MGITKSCVKCGSVDILKIGPSAGRNALHGTTRCVCRQCGYIEEWLDPYDIDAWAQHLSAPSVASHRQVMTPEGESRLRIASLVRLLIAKGLLTAEEYAELLADAHDAVEQRHEEEWRAAQRKYPRKE